MKKRQNTTRYNKKEKRERFKIRELTSCEQSMQLEVVRFFKAVHVIGNHCAIQREYRRATVVRKILPRVDSK